MGVSFLTFRRSVVIGFCGLLVAGASLFVGTRFATAASCVPPSTDYGTSTVSVDVPATATYHVWSRMAAPDANNNTYQLEIDGSSCYNVGGSSVPVYAAGATTYFVNDSSNWTASTNTGSPVDASLSAGVHTFKLIGNKPNVVVDRLILTQDSCVPSGTGDNCIVVADTLPPSAPDGLSVSSLTPTSLSLSWNAAIDNVGVDHYVVSRNGNAVGTVSGTSFNDSGLNSSTPYSYTVTAVDATGNISPASVPLAISTPAPPDTTPPSAPDGLNATNVSASGLTLGWSASTDDRGVDHYLVSRNGTTVVSTNGLSFVEAALDPSTTYTYVVTAVDAAGNMTSSQALSVTTLAPPDTAPPSVPDNFMVSNVTETGLNLAWNASTDDTGVDHYLVLRGGNQIAQVSSNGFTDSGLQAGTIYSYTVIAVDAAGNQSAASSSVVVTTGDFTPPSTPDGVGTSAVGGTSANLAWNASTDNVGVDHYVVSRDGIVIGTATATSFTDTGLTPASAYAYSVVAVDSAGNVSGSSSTLIVTTLDTIAPTSPTGLVASSVTLASVSLGWVASSDNVGVDHYVVTRDGVVLGSQTDTSFTDTTVVAATSYVYSVAAVDAAGNVSPAAGVSVTTPLPPDTTPPTTPAGLVASAVSDTSVTLGWQAATDDRGVDHYVISRGGNTIGQVTSLNFTDTGLTQATSYDYTVTAFDAAGNQSSPQSLTVTTKDVTSPSVPTGLQASNIGETSLNLQWVAATDNVGVDHYVVTRGSTVVGQVNGTSFTDTGLTAATSYSYSVSAVDASGNISAASTAFAVSTVDLTAPAVPGGLQASAVGTTTATLSWAASVDNVGVAGYNLYRGSSKIATVTGLSYTDTGLSPSTVYGYSVTAFDAAGNTSAASSPLAVTTPAPPDTTPPSTPGSFSATANSSTQVTLAWNASTDNVGVDHYSVNRDGTTLVASQQGLSYINSGLTPSTAYTYTVIAWDAAGNASAAATATVTTPAPPDTTAPSVPSGLRVTSVTGTSASLAWNASTDNVGVSSYEIYRGGSKVATVTGLTYTDTGLTPVTSYSYTVDAIDAAGNRSAQSGSVPVTTLDSIAPTAPATFSAQVSALGQVTLTWSAATDNVKVTGYKLSRGGTLIASPTALTYTDSGLAPNTAYSYTLVAVDAAGNSSPVKSANVTTPLDAAPLGAGWAGAYFNNTTLSGAAIGRLDSTVNFAWGTGSPMAGINADNFSVRWTGSLKPTVSGTYTFYTQSDDGVRLYLNGTQLINKWTNGGGSYSATASLTAGTSYNLTMEYYENTGTATAQLQWSGPGIAKAVLPASVMSSGSAGLSASYFSNNSLSGSPTVQRIDSTVNFSWGNGSPDSRLPSDNFSARWTGKVTAPVSGTYTFYTDSDNGVRLWVNGVLLVDNWTSHSLTTNSGKITLTAGQTYDIKLEYYDGTGSATSKLSWAYGSVSKTIIPSSSLRDR